MVLYEPLWRATRACLSAAWPRAPPPSGGACGARPPPPPPGGACGARPPPTPHGGACGARPPPACPPCAPTPPPPCRARAPALRRATRVVCCAPPPGQRPPCAPRLPACSLSCQHSPHQRREQSHRTQTELPSQNVTSCDHELDPVAKRLKMAKRAQQAQYEQEVAERAAQRGAPAGVPSATYLLGGERECARATDGCMYAVPHPRDPRAPTPRCGPNREPPPPRCVELAPDDGCRIQGDARLDPCAHRPRVMIQVDRSAATAPSPSPPAPAPAPAPRPAAGRATRAGDTSWCTGLQRPAPPPPRCRRPTIVEQLRSRSMPCSSDSREKRPFHTCTTLCKPTKSSSSGGLATVLRSKETLKEAGLGRVVSCESKKREKKCPSGKLDMCVPTGTERVSVLVSLHGAPAAGTCPSPAAGPSPGQRTRPWPSICETRSSTDALSAKSSPLSEPKHVKGPISPCDKVKSASRKRESWLSIKSIQKKLTDCRCTADSKTDSSPINCANSTGRAASSGRVCAEPTGPTACRPAGPCADQKAPSGKPNGACAKPEVKSDPCGGGGGNNTKLSIKRCSSTTTFIANTVLPSS